MARRTQKTAFGDDEYQFNPKGDIDVDDHTLRIQSLFENAKWLRGTGVMDDEEEKNIYSTPSHYDGGIDSFKES